MLPPSLLLLPTVLSQSSYCLSLLTSPPLSSPPLFLFPPLLLSPPLYSSPFSFLPFLLFCFLSPLSLCFCLSHSVSLFITVHPSLPPPGCLESILVCHCQSSNAGFILQPTNKQQCFPPCLWHSEKKMGHHSWVRGLVASCLVCVCFICLFIYCYVYECFACMRA